MNERENSKNSHDSFCGLIPADLYASRECYLMNNLQTFQFKWVFKYKRRVWIKQQGCVAQYKLRNICLDIVNIDV